MPRRSKMTTEEFVKNARQIHGEKYDYSRAEFSATKVPVTIICPEHGPFKMLPYNHLRDRVVLDALSHVPQKTSSVMQDAFLAISMTIQKLYSNQPMTT